MALFLLSVEFDPAPSFHFGINSVAAIDSAGDSEKSESMAATMTAMLATKPSVALSLWDLGPSFVRR